MPIVNCPGCGTSLSLDPADGSEFECPSCKKRLSLRRPAAAGPPRQAPPRGAPPPPRSALAPPLPSQREADSDDNEDGPEDAPLEKRRRKRKRSGPTLRDPTLIYAAAGVEGINVLLRLWEIIAFAAAPAPPALANAPADFAAGFRVGQIAGPIVGIMVIVALWVAVFKRNNGCRIALKVTAALGIVISAFAFLGGLALANNANLAVLPAGMTPGIIVAISVVRALTNLAIFILLSFASARNYTRR